jgi:small subunit ribosomal protein S15
LAVKSVKIKETKTKLVSQYGKDAKNTGASESQIALLTDRILGLTNHLKANKKDFSTQRGLLKLVGQRRRLLDYMKVNEPKRYLKLIGELELRK